MKTLWKCDQKLTFKLCRLSSLRSTPKTAILTRNIRHPVSISRQQFSHPKPHDDIPSSPDRSHKWSPRRSRNPQKIPEIAKHKRPWSHRQLRGHLLPITWHQPVQSRWHNRQGTKQSRHCRRTSSRSWGWIWIDFTTIHKEISRSHRLRCRHNPIMAHRWWKINNKSWQEGGGVWEIHFYSATCRRCWGVVMNLDCLFVLYMYGNFMCEYFFFFYVNGNCILCLMLGINMIQAG